MAKQETPLVYGAIDLGASNGRIIAGTVQNRRLRMTIVHRFSTKFRESDGRLYWDINHIFDDILDGLTKLAKSFPAVASIGVDTWGVDYGLLDDDGLLIDQPTAYRDRRTLDVIGAVHANVPPEELYKITGSQFAPYNTIYQLAAERQGNRWPRVARVALLPDLINYWLTGDLRCEITNSSTTGLLNAATEELSPHLLRTLGLRRDLFGKMIRPGEIVGGLLASICARTGLAPQTKVVAVGSHDTASAVAGTPAGEDAFGFISLGTWSLVGCELNKPLLTEASRLENFTNEIGVGEKILFLRNLPGLWILEECFRSWRSDGFAVNSAQLLVEASRESPDGPVFDVEKDVLTNPSSMPTAIRDLCMKEDGRDPFEKAALVRCILESLARAQAKTIARAEVLSDVPLRTVNIVGGGSLNQLLCQLTANASRRVVQAGPSEATAMGNLVVQAMAARSVSLDFSQVRQTVVRGSAAVQTYLPM